MDTFHEQGHTGYKLALDDWDTIKRLADLIAPYADVHFNASDNRGSYCAPDLGAFREKTAARDRPPDSVSVDGHTPLSDRVSAHVTLWPEHDAEYLVSGTDEEAVLYLKDRIKGIVAGAGEPWSEEMFYEQDEPVGDENTLSQASGASFLSHPNWAGISVLVVIALAVLGSLFFGQ